MLIDEFDRMNFDLVRLGSGGDYDPDDALVDWMQTTSKFNGRERDKDKMPFGFFSDRQGRRADRPAAPRDRSGQAQGPGAGGQQDHLRQGRERLPVPPDGHPGPPQDGRLPGAEPDPRSGRPRPDHDRDLSRSRGGPAGPPRTPARAAAMSRYLLRRVLGAIVVMWAVATLVFFMLRAVPGDPIAAMLFDVGDPAAAEALRQKFGLDQPVWVQYVRWFGARPAGRLRHLLARQRGRGVADRRRGLPAHRLARHALVPDRDRDRGAGRADLGAAAPLGARPRGHRGRVPRPLDAGFLGRDPVDHPVRRPSAMAAGDRLRAARRGLLALALAPDPALDRDRHDVRRDHHPDDPLLDARGAEHRLHAGRARQGPADAAPDLRPRLPERADPGRDRDGHRARAA